MAANGISTLATKELRQKAKLDQVSLDRAGHGNAKHYYDITNLPTQYSGNGIIDNANVGGLVAGRPWATQPAGIASLFAAGEKGAWYDPSDITTLFQDVAGTIPVTASGQAVARINDKSGNNAHATQSDLTKRPTYYNYPGTAYSALHFDGVDDFMVTGSLNFTGTNKVTATTGFHLIPPGTGTSRIMIEFGTSGATNGSFYITAKNNMRDHSIGARGTASLYAVFSNNDPQHDVITGLYDLSQSDRTLGLIPRLNGYNAPGLGYTGTDTGSTASMFGNLPLYIGARAGTTFFFTGNFYGAVIRGVKSSQPEITLAETWAASKLY
jgi:hypothetical protein